MGFLEIWLLFAFLLGALPFSVWVGKAVLGKDIRQFGDANPGATNVLRAGGKASGLLALLLDMLKGAIPVGIAHFRFDYSGWALILIALMPILGHAFSPFLSFRGGKAVAVTGGVWTGLTIWEGPTIGGLLMGLLVIWLPADGWVVLFAQVGMLGWLLLTPSAWNGLNARPAPFEILMIGIGSLLILAWKHRVDLSKLPHRKQKREAQ